MQLQKIGVKDTYWSARLLPKKYFHDDNDNENEKKGIMVVFFHTASSQKKRAVGARSIKKRKVNNAKWYI